jgi:excisionase family DNA binding protein
MKMATKIQLLTTGEFASLAGIASSKISKLIREGKIKAEKKSGKWMISSSELKAAQELSKKGKTAPKKKTSKASPKKATVAKKPAPSEKTKPAKGTASAAKAYTLEEFVNMTYLTETGVRQWLKQGRLTGLQNETGEWMIDAASLDTPHIKRLVR